MNSKDYLECGASMLGGIGVGALLMYLMDPENGYVRRRDLRRASGRVVHGVGENLGSAWQSASERARDIGEQLPTYRKQIAKMLPRYRRQPTYPSALTIGLASVGALALGAGLMFFMDPQGGRRRRALVRDKTISTARRTGHSLRQSGKFVSDHVRGMVHEARSAVTHETVSDTQLTARVRSELGRVVKNVGSIEVCADNGRVFLSGPILAHELDEVLRCVWSVRGVKDVENRLDVQTSPAGISGLQGI